MKIKYKMIFFILFILITSDCNFLIAQEQYIPADIKVTGERSWRRWGVMNGNLLRVTYFNTSHVNGLWWPSGSGHTYMDDMVPFVSAEAKDVSGNTVHPLECNYNWSTDISPDGLTEWGWQPLPGYLNPNQSLPAISHKPDTWPANWPDRSTWDGEWNGYFGRGILSADQETYYVVDDDADEEFVFYPDSTDLTRRGLGMRMSVRGLQWSHVLAEDCIFWIYDVTNVGTTDYEKTLFGMFIDSKNGGHDYDNGFYDTYLDITYIWDEIGLGDWGGATGWIGYGYLESPGIGDDTKDNDDDGLIDEQRDSGPGEYIFGSVGIYGADKWHWSGDEDGDWNLETDDVGMDGVGPLQANYTNLDEGEGDGIPTDGEPNFDRTDLDESDQIGLQAVSLHNWGTYPLHEDDLVWEILANQTFDPIQNFSKIGILYSSGPFNLMAGRTERFSIALLMGEDLDDLIRNKETVQGIFNANYRFAKPPDKPTVKAVAGDGIVTLTWDHIAELSRDPFLGIDPDSLGYKKDFEGYVIYKSTDPGFLDSRLITDGYGNKVFRIPVAQFDYVNGIYGTSEVGLPNGAHFYLGDDTGLTHTWTDTDVINGQTYYYAVVSYDAGDPNLGSGGLPPSECTSIIERDLYGEVHSDMNTAIVMPGVPAAGYRAPQIEEPVHTNGTATGSITVSVLIPDEFVPDEKYRITFYDTTLITGSNTLSVTLDYSVTRLSDDSVVVYKSTYLDNMDMYPLFDGLGISVFNNSSNPFLSDDVIEFETGRGVEIDNISAKADMDKIAVVPNPYVVTNLLEQKNPLITSGRGERIIQFIHLPQKCTIRIYNIRGYIVDIIEHEGDMDDGVEKWGLVSKDGIDIAFGIYIYHVVAEELGNKMGRFAIIK